MQPPPSYRHNMNLFSIKFTLSVANHLLPSWIGCIENKLETSKWSAMILSQGCENWSEQRWIQTICCACLECLNSVYQNPARAVHSSTSEWYPSLIKHVFQNKKTSIPHSLNISMLKSTPFMVASHSYAIYDVICCAFSSYFWSYVVQRLTHFGISPLQYRYFSECVCTFTQSFQFVAHKPS